MFLKSSKFREHTDEVLLGLYSEKNDLKIIGILYERYMHLVFGVCLKYLKDQEESKDAVMDIFEGLVEKLKNHDVKEFRKWLFIVAKNHCLMVLRKNKNKPDEISENIHQMFMESNQHEHPNDISDPEKFQEKLKMLPAEQQECLRLFYFDGHSYNDIVESTGYSASKVKSYIQNGKRNLERILKEENEK